MYIFSLEFPGVAQPDLGSRHSVVPIPGGYSSGSYLPPLPYRTSLADSDPRTLQVFLFFSPDTTLLT
jgi:hypothetical protein